MSDRKLLFVTQELDPYTALSTISEKIKNLPVKANDNGYEVRILMPRFGLINERRHRLHEVVRLSGMNIIVDDEDYPLIIKVASLPGTRGVQVYFLDNDEFFKRKQMFTDEDNVEFEDNQERMVFFCKGVMEIVKKFGWPPDIIHCHGTMTSLVPFYIKTAYQNDPVFQDAKVIYSVYEDVIGKNFDKKFFEIAAINDLTEKSLKSFLSDDKIDLNRGGINSADGIVIGSELVEQNVLDAINDSGKPVQNLGDQENFVSESLSFYNELIGE
ncbi:MAG TPA: glycogen/starch synthase [Saprospiraceae bacterium]|nr:glycogen/starch synthase [Saprospiraceae bacterium]MCB9329004.1 glycogen/starch synthase [Lewinellaceae bacterium]HPK08807.1 glycogen/starch synthase [Saprospiraceae bacterium]HPQ21686.1 glycogen/starch synthase [Saprospiraceae bacterium]HRX29171.1 glycogen/starch synthase [Saprospiraceae bacterium]